MTDQNDVLMDICNLRTYSSILEGVRFHANSYAIAGKQRHYEHTIQYLDLANLYQRMALSLGCGANDPIKEHIDILETLQKRDTEAA